jgi:outer membrane protein TolC
VNFSLVVVALLALAPPDPALDALVRAAIERTPELASARAAVEAAKRRVEPAGTLPDPMAALESRDNERGLMLTQAFPWPGKLALAAKAAASEAREVETGSAARAARTIEARVRTAWYDLILARALDRLIDERRETASQIEATTRERYAAGLAVQQDVLRAQVELARLEESKAGQRAMIAARLAELTRLTGVTDIGSAELPVAADLPAGVVEGVLAGSPEIAAARQGIETGRLRVEMAKKNWFPDVGVSAGTMSASVGVSIPLWTAKRQRNELAEAEARVAGQTADVEAVTRDLEVRTRERIASLEAANEIARLYRQKVIPLDELSLESALASYRAAKVPFVTVLDAVNALYADRAGYLGRLAEAAKWRVAIDEAR